MPTRMDIEKVIRSLLIRYHAEYALLFGSYARGEETPDSDKVVLPVTNFDAYFGNGTFSKKWLPKEFDDIITRDLQSNGVSRYMLHENLIKLT